MMSRIRCKLYSGRIKSLQNSGYAHYSDAINCDPNYRNAVHKHYYKHLAVFRVLARVMHDFKGGKMSRSCLCQHVATMRLLLNVSLVILQRFTIILLHDLSPSICQTLLLIYICCISIYVSDVFICDYLGNSCEPNQNLSVARIFCHFWLCANC